MAQAGSSPGLATLALHAGESEGETDGRQPQRDWEPGFRLTANWLAESGRSRRPSTARFEERVAALEGGTAAIAFAFAGAGLATTFQTLLRTGDEIIAARSMAQSGLGRFRQSFKSQGWTIVWAETDDPNSFQRGVSPRTQAILAESVTETGEVSDVAGLADVARKAQVPLIIDNTNATAALCRPISHGADAVVHASGERLAGSPSDCGVVVDAGTFDWTLSGRYPVFGESFPELGGSTLGELAGNFALVAACRLRVAQGLAADVAPAEADILLAGMETITLRMGRHSENARVIAAFLFDHKAVSAVSYAGLPGDRHYNLARRYCPDGAGPVVTFAPTGGTDPCQRVLARLRLFQARNGGSGSRADLAAPLEDAGAAQTSRRIRLFVGIEDTADLIADLERALQP